MTLLEFLEDLREYLDDRSDIDNNGYANEAMLLLIETDKLIEQEKQKP
jgi:hypothetical protein